MSALPANIEAIHPSLWRASQLARSYGRTVDTGYPALSAELAGGGWPLGTLIELMVRQNGIGEMRLLRPALTAVGKKTIALLQPPHVANALAFAYLGIPADNLMVIRAPRTADALWSAEQILKAGTCGALLFWQQHVRGESLRRLLLAAQLSETLFCMIRPLATRSDASPATLRLAIDPVEGGIAVQIVKRKGPIRAELIRLDLTPSPILLSPFSRKRTGVDIGREAIEPAHTSG